MDSVQHSVKKLSFRTFLHIYFRSFFFQGSWSQKYRQNLGFAYSMEPVGKELYKNADDYRAFLLRSCEHYNGNPFMAPLVLGAVANMEVQLRNDNGVTEEDIRRFKNVVGPATGSVGDRLFWSNLRPFGILLGIFFAVFFGFWGVLVFLAFFNIPTFILKWHWLKAGFRLGPKVVHEIKNKNLDFVEQTMEIFGSFLVAFLSIVYFAIILVSNDYSVLRFLPCAAGLFIFTALMLKKRISLQTVFSLSLAVSVLLGLSLKWLT